MASDLKTLAIMIGGAIGGVYVARQSGVMSEIFRDLSFKDAIIKAPALGLGVGKDNINNTTYMIPAAIAIGAYFLL